LLKSENLGKEKALLEKQWAMLQFQNLQNQLNPHFFFNSIASLNTLIHENQELASSFLQQLSKVYRYILQNRDKQLVSLESELKFVENYISLLKTRFNGFLTIDLKISEDVKEMKIVPVSVQVLIENALKHNSLSAESPLHISIYNEQDTLTIENNIQLKPTVETSNKVGLENMKNLYRYLSDKKVEITTENDLFKVKIPLLPE
jgi:two-component system, LytTR family, sensor kinase